MGRKKKTAEQPQVVEKPQIKETKKEEITPFAYSGSVTVKLKVGNKVIQLKRHNEGLPALKEFFCKCLDGERGILDSRPRYIDLRYAGTEDAAENNWVTCLYNKASITYSFVDNARFNNWAVYFQAAIPRSLISKDISTMTDKYFRLYLCSSTDDMAYMKIEQEKLQIVVPGTSLIVEWVLQLLNKDEIQPNEE